MVIRRLLSLGACSLLLPLVLTLLVATGGFCVERPTGPSHCQSPRRVILSGAPGSGKGTQSHFINKSFGLVHLSTGDMLRDAMAKRSPLGEQVRPYMERAHRVPDELITQLVCDRLGQPDCCAHGWILDGFPRTLAQAEALAREGHAPDLFLSLEVPPEVISQRICDRRMDPESGKIYNLQTNPPPPDVMSRIVRRNDDTPELFQSRIKDYLEQIKPIKTFYSDRLVILDGSQAIERVQAQIQAAFRGGR